jgi:organic hydroperoxide reductase OsmC/OhrA
MHSPDLDDILPVATPPPFPKGVERIWSPEHLFTAAVSSCLMTTFLSVAESSKLEFTKFRSTAKGKLELIDGRYIMSEVTLAPVLTICRDEDIEKAKRVLHRAEAACLISNSIKSKIIFNPEVEVVASLETAGV